MPEFLKLVPPSEALALLMHCLPDYLPGEELIESIQAVDFAIIRAGAASKNIQSSHHPTGKTHY